MKTNLKKTLMYISLVCGIYGEMCAQTVNVEVLGIRSDKGYIMLMAQAKGPNLKQDQAKPIMEMKKAINKKVIFELKEMTAKEYTISIFHDENGNYQLDLSEDQRPIEGFARQIYNSEKKAKNGLKMKLYYPISD
jgi:uncharacterized protein (DUF2141 family)